MGQGGPAERQGRGNPRKNQWCDFCKSYTLSTDACYIKLRIDRYNQAKEREGKADPQPSTSQGQTASVSRIEEGNGDVTLLYTPACINGHDFRRCMVDTGSEVNVLPLREAVRLGIAFDPCAITQIIGFNGSPSPVEGMAECSLHVSPGNKAVSQQFLVTNGVSGGPILGFPALEALGLSVNCKDRELLEPSTGKVVRCAAATKPRKN